MVNKGDCRDTFLQRSSAWCGCSDSSIECPLCPDGSVPEQSKEENVLYGWNCHVFEYVHSLLSEAECHIASEILEFDATAFCCPGVKEKPKICSFCPNGSVINPEKLILSGYGPLKCGEIEESLSFIPTEMACIFTKNKFDIDLCCASASASSFHGNSALHLMLGLLLLVGIAFGCV
jgi:hypothetical protein